jgi:hypothetical protein
LLLGGVIFYLRNKTIQKKIELEEYELNKLKNQIKNIEEQTEKTKNEINKLKKLKLEEKKRRKDLEELYKTPFQDPQASDRFVVKNPCLGGYRCFYQEGLPLEDYPISRLVHRWVWKEHHGRWPRPGYHIHHIDGNKNNNDPSNLEEKEGEEHFRMHRTK